MRVVSKPVALVVIWFVALAAPASAVELVARGASWRYLDDGSDPGPTWREPGFDDSGWAAAPAQLGYGDGDEDSLVGFGPNPQNKFITTWFRHSFTLAAPGSLTGLTLRLLRDDGAVVHLNGAEVYRNNLPPGPIGYLTPASAVVGDPAEDAFLDVALDPGGLVAGANLLAVEIHQANPTSSDTSFELELSAEPASIVRGPYLQVATPDGVSVRWRTDLATESRVSFGPAPNDLSSTAIESGARTEHQVELSGLEPATRYFYAVGTPTLTLAGADADHFFETSPAAGSAEAVRIWAIGDSGDCSRSAAGCAAAAAVTDAYLDVAAGRLADVWLMLGDNAYSSGTENEHTRAVFDVYPQILRNTVLWPAPGNHEFGVSDSPSQTGPYYDAFSMPSAGDAGGVASGTEAYYSFDHANVHFVALDSFDTSRAAPANPIEDVCAPGGGGAMYQWLCADLAATQADWVIAYWHHPPYTKGSHDSDSLADSQGISVEMRGRFAPVLEELGVDLVLTGHSHSYERSILLDGHYGFSGSFGAQHVMDDGDGDPAGDGAYAKPTLGTAPHEGAVYAVVGSSSLVSGGPLDHPVMAVSINDLGSLLIDVDGDVLDGVWIDDAGAVRDRFRIAKGPDDDSDGIPDASDPCPQFANSLPLVDTDGDAIPDECQCGELTNDGLVDANDDARLRSHLAGLLLLALAELERCAVTGTDGLCDVRSVAVIARDTAGLEPSVAQACPAGAL